MSFSKRCGVDLDYDKIEDSMDRLPLQATKNNGFIDYPKINFKLSPAWEAAKPYLPTVSRILFHTGGANVNQASFAKHSEKWAADKKYKQLTPAVLEKGCYRLRAIFAQLGNHKSRDRMVPQPWKKNFPTRVR